MSVPADAGGLFLDTPHGRSFCLRYRASGPLCALLVSPFAEEMNRARRMWTLLALELATQGVSVLIPDLHGTGESDGDFADARWEHWLEDLAAVRRQAIADGASRVVLVGLRLGALLALDFARRQPGARQALAPAAGEDSVGGGAAHRRPAGELERLVLWQPVLSGQQFMNQFLRLKLAAGLRDTGAPKLTTAALRERLAAGEALEIAGYELAPQLLAAIDALELESLAAGELPPIEWLEVSTGEPPALAPASARLVQRLRDSGRSVQARAVPGEPFWALQEITVAPSLVSATAGLLSGRPS